MAGIQDLDTEVAQLRQDMTSIKNDLGNVLAAMKERAAEQGQVAYSKAREAGGALRTQAAAAQEELGHYVEARPLSSVMVAFGTGFVLGALLSLRR